MKYVMKGFYRSCLRVCLILAGCIAFATQVSAVTLETIRVTDETGVSQTLSEPTIRYISPYRDYMADYLPVVLSRTKVAWMHFSQIKTAEFEEGGLLAVALSISITLHNGQVMKGLFPETDLYIKGKRNSQEVSLTIEDVKTIEFVQFSEGSGEDKRILNPEEASSRWKQERKRLRVWTIVDGDEEISADSVAILDVYSTNRSGSFISFGTGNRNVSVLDEKIPLIGARILVDMPLSDIAELEFTGKKVEGKPEVVVSTTDGSVGTFVLLMRTEVYYHLTGNDVDIVYGDLDKDDLVIYQVPYGWEGISILPLRRIVCRQQ